VIGQAPLRFEALAVADLPRLQSFLPDAGRLVWPAMEQELKANPDTSADTPWLFCLSDSAGTLVSWIRVWADCLSVEGRHTPWLWTGDLRTLESLRGKGLATELQRQGTDWAMARGIGRGSVFSTDQTLHIYEKLGYLQPGHASRRVLLASGRPVIAAHLRGPVATLATTAVRPIAALARRLLLARCRRWCRQSVVTIETDARSPAVDRTLASAASRLRVHFNLSPAKLQWKLDLLAEKPGTLRLLTISDRTSRPLALAVTRTRVEVRPLAGRYRDFLCTTLMDFALAEPTTYAARALVGHVAREFLESDVEVLQFISYDDTVTRMASAAGFVPAGRGMSFACRLPPGLQAPERADHISTWPVTHFSGDALLQ